jgi:hypothetical protein
MNDRMAYNKKLSRFGRLRIGSGASQENLYDFEVLSEGREVFVDGSDASLVGRSHCHDCRSLGEAEISRGVHQQD